MTNEGLTSKRLFFILWGLLLLLAGFSVAAVVMGNDFIESRTQRITDLRVESAVLDRQLESLAQAKQDVAEYSELATVAKSIVPQEKDQARTVREIINIAGKNGVPIANISFPASSLGEKKSGSGTEETQVTPVEGIDGVYKLEITVQSAADKPVPYRNMLSFLSDLQNNRRTAHITNLSVTPSPENRDLVTFGLIINAYIRP